MLGHRLDDKSLKQAIKEADPAGVGKLEFEPFACFASKYVEVEEDAEAVAKELREAFLLYDRDAKGYITVEVLRQILHEIDDKITPGDLDLMIEEIDADGSDRLSSYRDLIVTSEDETISKMELRVKLNQ
ncbi:hypothetical protein HA402_016203 [Bradysia odoriphaga]|nr:hypothetical protein HA402_016203 [Bradysia odoriphaga]